MSFYMGVLFPDFALAICDRRVTDFVNRTYCDGEPRLQRINDTMYYCPAGLMTLAELALKTLSDIIGTSCLDLRKVGKFEFQFRKAFGTEYRKIEEASLKIFREVGEDLRFIRYDAILVGVDLSGRPYLMRVESKTNFIFELFVEPGITLHIGGDVDRPLTMEKMGREIGRFIRRVVDAEKDRKWETIKKNAPDLVRMAGEFNEYVSESGDAVMIEKNCTRIFNFQ